MVDNTIYAMGDYGLLASYPAGWMATATWHQYAPTVSNQGALTGVSQADPFVANLAILQPKWQVFRVIYAPPGTNLSPPTLNLPVPTVAYTTDSASGVTNSYTNSYGNSASVEATAGISIEDPFGGGASGSVTASFSTSIANTTDASLTTTNETKQSDTLVLSNCADGIDHNQDLIVILINAELLANVSPADNSSVWFETTVGGADPILQPISVAALKRALNTTKVVNGKTVTVPGIQPIPNTMTFTQAEIKLLLSFDPFANAPGVTPRVTQTLSGSKNVVQGIDTNRYLRIEPLPYVPDSKIDWDGITTYTQTTDDQNANESTLSYSVGISVTATVGNPSEGPYASLTVSASHDWSSSTYHAVDDSSSYQCNLQFYNPSSKWKGPSQVIVYLDKLYRTLMFSFVDTNNP